VKAHLVQGVIFYLENVDFRESCWLRERKVSGKLEREEEEGDVQGISQCPSSTVVRARRV
jgi:hypothetical protein